MVTKEKNTLKMRPHLVWKPFQVATGHSMRIIMVNFVINAYALNTQLTVSQSPHPHRVEMNNLYLSEMNNLKVQKYHNLYLSDISVETQIS